MSKEVVKKDPLNVAKSFPSSITESFNNLSNNYGVSMHNKNYVIYYLNGVELPKGKIEDYLPKNEDNIAELVPNYLKKITEQNAQTKIFPTDRKIMNLIWKHLDIEDKFNFTKVCKRFNMIVSEMECFRLVVHFPTMVQDTPRLSRKYKIVIFDEFRCNELDKPLLVFLKHLSDSVIDLIFYDCQFNLMTLHAFLRELPLLESLELNMNLTMEKDVQLFLEDCIMPLKLRDFKIRVNSDKLQEILVIFASASNIESLSLLDAVFDVKLFDYLENYKSLKFLSLTKCIINKECKFSNLKSLQFNSRIKNPPKDYRSFDYLHQLRTLHLDEVNTESLDILNTKCINLLTKLEVSYTSQQNEKLNNFFKKFMFQKQIDESALLKYNKSRGKPITIETKCPSSNNIIKTQYHVKCCTINRYDEWMAYGYGSVFRNHCKRYDWVEWTKIELNWNETKYRKTDYETIMKLIFRVFHEKK